MSSRKRVVAVPIPMQGHINPMLELCYQLADSGIDITFVNTDRNHEKLAGSTAPVSKVTSSGTITFIGIFVPSICHGGPTESPNESLNAALVGSDSMAEPLEEVLSNLEGVSFLLTDGYLGWSQAVADKFNIPRAALWTSNVGYSLANYHLPVLIENGYASRKEGSSSDFDDDHLVTCVPGLEPMHPTDLPSVMHFESEEDPGFASRIRKIQELKQAAWVLINSVEEIEKAGVEAMQRELGTGNYITVGPLLPLLERRKSLWREDPACLKWLDRQKPGSVLYISFGSLATISGAQLVSFAKGLEDSQQPFLWAMRPNLMPAADSDAHREEFEGIVERCRKTGQGILVEWSPQVEVLEHPATGGHWSHCGWNSVLESMLTEVPILGWPCIAEQTMNCKRIVSDWGIGLRFTKNKNRDRDQLVSAGEVALVVKQLFSEDEGKLLRKRIQGFSELVKVAVKSGGSSRLNFERFARAASL